MAYAEPFDWELEGTPSHLTLIQDLIASPLSLRSLNDVSTRVYRTSNLSIPHNDRTAISWQASIWMVGSTWAIGASTRLVAPVDGVYLLTCKTSWTPNNAGRRGVGYKINGTGAEFDMQFQSSQAGACRLNGADLILLKAGDYVECQGMQSSGGNLNLNGGTQTSSNATFTLIATGTKAPIWTPPMDWAAGTIGTPWRFNTQWRDNLLNLRAGRGHVVKLSLKENQTVSNNERVPLSWDVQQFQIGSIWESGSHLRAPVDGWYLVLPTLEWRTENLGVPGAFRGVGIRVNDHSPHYDLQFQSSEATGASTNGKRMIWLEKDDFLEVYAFNDAEQSLKLNGSVDRTRVAMCLMYG